MQRTTLFAIVLLVPCLSALADEVNYVVKDGVTYQETRRVVRRPIVQTHTEPREQTIYRQRFSTDLKSTERKYVAPLTEYRWEPQWEQPWNPFASPRLVYRWMPATRWVERTETVRIPVTQTTVVPETITTHVPVTTQQFVEDEYITRVAVASRPGATGSGGAGSGDASLARRETIGGLKRLDSDPPRDGTWRPAETR